MRSFSLVALLLVLVTVPLDGARAFTVARINANNTETVLNTFTSVGRTESQLQGDRASALTAARALKAQNPSRRYIVYGPTDVETARVGGDRVWDSDVDQ